MNKKIDIETIQKEIEAIFSNYLADVKSKISSIESNGTIRFDISIGGTRQYGDHTYKYEIEYYDDHSKSHTVKSQGVVVSDDTKLATEWIKYHYEIDDKDIKTIHLYAVDRPIYEIATNQYI